MTAPYLPTFQINTPIRLALSALTTSAVVLYTTPSSIRANIQDIVIANTTAGTLTYTVYLVPSGASAGTSNAIFYQVSLAANTSYHWVGTHILFSGDTIQALGSATGLTISISGQQAS